MKFKKIDWNIVKTNMSSFLFCIFLWVFMIVFFMSPKSEYSENEKRVLQNMPEFTFNSLSNGSYGKNFEKYLSDHFSYRKFFIGFNAYYDLYSGRNGSNGIYKGKQGYLIAKPVVPKYDSLDKNIKKINSFCKSVNIPSYIAIVPSCGHVMDNNLPYNHMKYHDAEILDKLKSEIENYIKYINLEKVLRSQREKEVFYKTDHHWTTQGAYIAYLECCSAMELSPKDETLIDKTSYSGFYGTSYSKSGLWLSHPDSIDIWRYKDEDKINVTISDGADGIKFSDSFFFEERLKEMDKYPVFLDGNHSLVKIENSNSPNKKLLIIKDSFAHSIVPFLSQNFREIYMVDPRYYKSSITEIIKSNDIDCLLVLYGIDDIVNDGNILWIK